MSKEFYQIVDLRVALKDFEPIVKGGDARGRLWLVNGNNFKKKIDAILVADGRVFKMRPREAWGNWLLCAVLEYIHGVNFSFQDSEEGDGIIFNRETKQGFVTEHVSAMDYQGGQKLPKGENRVLWAINKKIEKTRKDPNYAKGKHLVVFVDGAGEWYPNKVARMINKHDFAAIYCVGLIDASNKGYNYGVTSFYKEGAPVFRIEINGDFTNWKVLRVQ